jgi:arylsulfatase A-like enzyme
MDVLTKNGTRADDEFYFYRNDELQAIRDGKWKYKKPYKQKKKVNKSGDTLTDYSHKEALLFDLEKDPFETINLLDNNPSIGAKLEKKIEEFEKQLDPALTGLEKK